jgi:hypothetical protein
MPQRILHEACDSQEILLVYSLPSIKTDIKTQELALRRGAPQRLIFHWEGSMIDQIHNLLKVLFLHYFKVRGFRIELSG